MVQLRRWLTPKACLVSLISLMVLWLAFPTISGRSASAGQGSTFPQPEVRRSRHGVLRTTLRASIADNQMVDQFTNETRIVHTPTFEGTIPAPTLSVKPGDTLSINLNNDLPSNPTGQRDMFFPHDPYTINLHTHGLEVSPLGISDNIFRIMEPGTSNRMEVRIPRDHPSGTYWYHTHKHGSVTFQFLGGMAGFLIIRGGPGTLDALPKIKAAKDLVMAFQEIRTNTKGNVVFVNQQAIQFGTFPFGTQDPTLQGVWSTYGLDGAPGRSNFYFTTNGVTNPTLHMRPGEVQRWRLLNATQGENLLLTLEGHGLNIVAMDGITVGSMIRLAPGTPLVISPGQRYDVLVKAGKSGTYRLLSQDPATPASVSPSGIDPEARTSRHSFDFPEPCGIYTQPCDPTKMLAYPFPLATVMVDGRPKQMKLPAGPLPVPKGLPSIDKMINTTPNKTRHVAFELCGQMATMSDPTNRLPSCGWYFAKYDANYWGGEPFETLLMMRDDDDRGVPNNDPNMPLVDFKKEGLFAPDQPLFDDMIANNYEEWTVINRSFSDHPFHIHQNPFLVTKINGQTLSTPEWHDTIIVPGVVAPPGGFPPNINDAKFGSITFRIHFNPVTVGCFVTHCHTLSHEDLGMMQRLDILPGPNQPSGCVAETMVHSKPPSIPQQASAGTGIMSPTRSGALKRRTMRVTQK
jgi:FtsP/CotA-like multicopper oxidase with cupredoxin domain